MIALGGKELHQLSAEAEVLTTEKQARAQDDITIYIKQDKTWPSRLPSFFRRFFSGLAALLGVLLIGALLCVTAWPLIR